MSKEVMQKALDALELWEKSFPNWWVCSVDNKSHEAIAALRAALAEQPQPVAYQDTAKHDELVSAENWEHIDPMYQAFYQPLYTHPAARLTDEEILKCNYKDVIPYVRSDPRFLIQFARAIEARVRGEK